MVLHGMMLIVAPAMAGQNNRSVALPVSRAEHAGLLWCRPQCGAVVRLKGAS